MFYIPPPLPPVLPSNGTPEDDARYQRQLKASEDTHKWRDEQIRWSEAIHIALGGLMFVAMTAMIGGLLFYKFGLKGPLGAVIAAGSFGLLVVSIKNRL